MRTAIPEVKFLNLNGVHGGLGSTKAHNELFAIIDTSNGYSIFVRKINNWANYRMKGGVWFDMETEWANALKEVPPKKISVNIEPIYSNHSMRPDSFLVEYEIRDNSQ